MVFQLVYKCDHTVVGGRSSQPHTLHTHTHTHIDSCEKHVSGANAVDNWNRKAVKTFFFFLIDLKNIIIVITIVVVFGYSPCNFGVSQVLER